MPESDIEWAVQSLTKSRKQYKMLDDYYEGDHPLLFATEKFRNAFGPLFAAFADNLCPAVVDATAERLHITGWDGKAAKKAEKIAKKVKFNRVMAQVVKGAAKFGDYFILVWKDKDGQPVLWPHDPMTMCIDYSEEEVGVIDKAAKAWISKEKEKKKHGRLTIYYDDHVERYVTKSSAENGLPEKRDQWEAYSEDIDAPDGMPVFHFGNAAELGEMGVSELKDVIPLQNALNKSVCDMLVAMEFVAYPQRYATGLQVEIDQDTGKPTNPPFVPGVDRIWTAAGDVKFGQFQVAELTGFLEVQSGIREEIARVSGTPTHFMNLVDEWPTGEALKVSEGRLIKKVENRGVTYTDPAVGVIERCLDITGKGGKDLDLEPVWANAAPHNPLLDAETQLVKQQVGVSKSRSLSELGYDDALIEEMQKENEDEAKKAADAAMKAVAPTGGPTAFNRSGSPGQASKPAPMKQQQQKKPVKAPSPTAGKGETQEG